MKNDVVDLNTIRPKSESGTYQQQRYVLTYNPHATENSRWNWTVKFSRVYEFSGTEPTIEGAKRKATAKIRDLIKRSSDNE